jgi:hypothetical protein
MLVRVRLRLHLQELPELRLDFAVVLFDLVLYLDGSSNGGQIVLDNKLELDEVALHSHVPHDQISDIRH